MEALSHAATVADLIKISSAADWQGCDVRRFGWAAAAKLITLGSAEKYKNDADGEKARVDGIFAKYKAASSRAVQSRAEWIKVAEMLGLDPSDVRKAGSPVHLPARVSIENSVCSLRGD